MLGWPLLGVHFLLEMLTSHPLIYFSTRSIVNTIQIICHLGYAQIMYLFINGYCTSRADW